MDWVFHNAFGKYLVSLLVIISDSSVCRVLSLLCQYLNTGLGGRLWRRFRSDQFYCKVQGSKNFEFVSICNVWDSLMFFVGGLLQHSSLFQY